MQLYTLSVLDGLFIMSIYITAIREHVEGLPELSALIKSRSSGEENAPCKMAQLIEGDEDMSYLEYS